MDDRFLNELRRDPSPQFTRSLAERLRRASASRPATVGSGGGLGLRPAFAAAGVLAGLVTLLVFFPSVRASAQAFLSLFRVRNFVTVPVDKTRIDQLEKLGNEPLQLLGNATTSQPGTAQRFANANEAFANAGWIGREPSFLPDGIQADSAFVTGGANVDVRLDAGKANQTFDALGMSDLRLPLELDGALLGVRIPRAVGLRYVRDDHRALFLQAPNPEVSMPPGMDLVRLGEIGLRVAGLDAAEAKRFAANVDWTSTMLVPVPRDASVIREVEISGHKGLLVETNQRDQTPGARPDRGGNRTTVLWSDDDRVYALTGNLSSTDLVAMAIGVR